MRRRAFVASLMGMVAAACGGPSAPAPTAAATPAAAPAAGSPSATAPLVARPAPTTTPSPSPASCARDSSGHILFVDTHAHLLAGTRNGPNYDGASDVSIEKDDAGSARFEIVLPPPFPASDYVGAYDYPSYQVAVKKRATRMAFLGGGGGTLNPMIQEATKAGGVSADLERRFQTTASQIIAAGALGFGEMTAEHLSLNPNHPYLTAPPDHALFLLLADLAASANVPIDLHMIPIPRDQPMFPPVAQVSPNNPKTLNENVSRFERLLAHNPSARIVWAHGGDVFTGCGDPLLAQRLLAAHPNLYLQLKADTNSPAQTLVRQGGAIDAMWLAVIRAFPDRIVLGGDNFWEAPGALVPFQMVQNNLSTFRSLVDQLPADVACRVAADNAVRIYRLG